MALTFRRWVVLAILACAAVVVALLPVSPSDMGGRFMPSESSRLQRASGQLNRARKALEIVQLEERVVEMISQSPLPAGTAPTIMTIGAATDAQRLAFAEALHGWWPRRLNDSIAVGIVLGGDSANLEWQDRHLLPTDTDGRSCITVVSTHTWYRISRLNGREVQRRFATELAPCLFLAMFGRPGPQIERWINEKGFHFATYFQPAEASVSENQRPEDADPMAFVLFELEWSLYGTMPLGVKCLNGQITECASAVFSFRTTARPAHRGFRAQTMPWRAPFGTLTSSYLFDLYREIGPERFTKFWSSTLPLDQAIKEATGMPLGEWTHQWVVGQRTAFRPGPLPVQSSVMRVAGLTALLLAVTMIYGVRRTVLL